MRTIIIGLGNIGKKRREILKEDCVATIDPYNPEADYKHLKQVSPDRYDAAILSVPDEVKIELLQELLSMGKHTLIEKPLLFPDSQKALSLQQTAEKQNTIWYTSYNHRFEPHIARIAGLLQENITGKLYHAHILYGNGTVRNSLGTWRENGRGVLEDLGCHLIDLVNFLFSNHRSDYDLWSAQKIESKTIDHCIFASADQKIVLECASTMWKNRFSIDIYGELASIHLQGLCKWGPSELQIHKRIFPSGRPHETRQTIEQSDPTWFLDFKEFEERITRKQTSYSSDVCISDSIHNLARQSEKLFQVQELKK